MSFTATAVCDSRHFSKKVYVAHWEKDVGVVGMKMGRGGVRGGGGGGGGGEGRWGEMLQISLRTASILLPPIP